jgi:hypothetical protein
MVQSDNITHTIIETESNTPRFDYGGGLMLGWGDPVRGAAVRIGYGIRSFSQDYFYLSTLLEIDVKKIKIQALIHFSSPENETPSNGLYIGVGGVLFPIGR